MDINTFECFHKGSSNYIQIQTTRFVFKDMVVAAAEYINDHYNPVSKDYIQPSAYSGIDRSFSESNIRFLNADFAKRMDVPGSPTGFHLLVLEQYIKARNSGEIINFDTIIDIMVYLAAMHYHNHAVKCIEKEHSQFGKMFGSSTHFQKFDWFAQVEHWYDVFDFENIVLKPHHLPLPCDQLHYYDEADQPNYKKVYCREIKTLPEIAKNELLQIAYPLGNADDYVLLKYIPKKGNLYEHMPEFNQIIWSTKKIYELPEPEKAYVVVVLREEIVEVGYEIVPQN